MVICLPLDHPRSTALGKCAFSGEKPNHDSTKPAHTRCEVAVQCCVETEFLSVVHNMAYYTMPNHRLLLLESVDKVINSSQISNHYQSPYRNFHSTETHHHYVPSVVNRSAVMDLLRSRSCATLIQSLYDIFVHSLMLSVHIVLGLPRPLLPFILPSISNRNCPS